MKRSWESSYRTQQGYLTGREIQEGIVGRSRHERLGFCWLTIRLERQKCFGGIPVVGFFVAFYDTHPIAGEASHKIL